MAITKIQTQSGIKYKAVFTYYVGSSKKRSTKRFDKKSDATKWEAEQKIIHKNEVEHGHSIKLRSGCSFKEYSELWYQRMSGRVTEGTLEEYGSKINKKIIPYFGENKMLAKISSEDCEDFTVYLRQLDLSPKTINLYITLLKQILKDSYEKNYIKTNPSKNVALLKVDERDFDYWAKDEVKEFIKKAKDWHFYEFALIAVNTGMRLGEIANLRPRDINFKTNFIRVSSTAKKKGGEGTTKSKKIRMIPMNKRVKKIFTERVEELKNDQLIFTYKDKVINISHFTDRYWRPILLKHNLRAIRFHDLRHTFASHFMMNEGNVFTLQKILGHSDIKETMRYAHLSPLHLQDAKGVVNF